MSQRCRLRHIKLKISATRKALTLLILSLVVTQLSILLVNSQDDSSASSSSSLASSSATELELDSDGFTIDDQLSDVIAGENFARIEMLLKEEEEEDKELHKNDHSEAQKPAKSAAQIFEKLCPSGFFACSNGECISPKWRCDGHYDCDDFSDELNCSSIDLLQPPISEMKIIDSVVPKAASPPPTPTATHQEIGDITFNSTQEPLMLFSTGLSIRGLWMRKRIYFDVVSMGLRPPKVETPSITQALSVFFDIFNINERTSPASSRTKGAEEVAFKSRSTIVGVDMDPNDKEVFWVELGKNAGVFSTVIDDEQFEARHRRQFTTKHKTIVDFGLLAPEDIALDSIAKNIYITDAGLQAIVACSVKHSHCRIIVRENLHKPRAIIADPSTGWLTYTDWGDHPGIFLASMDGKRRETLIDKDVVWPNGLAADYSTNQLYWADARLSKIERIDLTTRKRREVIKESAANPFSLSLFENRIYWSDWSGSEIRTCDKTYGNNTKVVIHTDNIYGIHIYHPNLYRDQGLSNPCWSKHCSHMCLLSPSSPFYADRKSGSIVGNCACPDSMALSIGDKATCYEVQLTFLLINVKNYIAQVFPERIGLHIVEKVIYSKDHVIHDVASDWLHYRLFFFDAAKQHIYLVDLSDKVAKIEQFMPTSQSVRGLLYDSWSENLYWLDSDRGTMSMCSVRGKFQTVIRKDLERPISMVLDSKNRVFYIAMLGSMPHIMRTDIFGSEQSDLIIIGTDIGLPVALHLDEKNQRLYWADARRESIESLDLDVKSQTSGIKPNSRISHRRKLGTILAFSVYHDNFLWTIKNGDYLYKAKISATSSELHSAEQLTGSTKSAEETRPVAFKLPPNPSAKDPSSDNKRIIMVDPKNELVNSPCQKRGCSHGCVLDSNHNAICVCPEAYKLQASNRSNCIAATHQDCGANMFKCSDTSHCILNSWKCDGTPDCDDGSDEKDCHMQPECPKGDFTCKNGHCISQAWHCDSTNDCADNSDEENCPKRVDNSCTVGYFPCGDGKCIPQLWRCDRERDCPKGNDEKDCRTEECKPNFFRCKDNSCIPHSWLCDKSKDCPQGDDEEQCAEVLCDKEQFLCDGQMCIDNKLKCDRHKDCADGTDESNCTEYRACPQHMITCMSDHHCIYPTDMCDGHQDCEDGSDERNCTTHRTCASYEIQCESLRTTLTSTVSGSSGSSAKSISDTNQHKKCIPKAWLCDGQDDCGDWSDEINEKCLPPSYDHMITTTSKPCHDGSFPCLSGECIKWNQVCDTEDNCLDGSDEGGKCLVACSINNGGCAQQCRPSPNGPSCACYDGYVMSNDTKTCEDVDECVHTGICSQYCFNYKGGYKCSCAPGYLLATDKRHCKALGTGDSFLLFMLPSKILSADLVRFSENVIASTDNVDITGLDFDYETKTVFWSESLKGQIKSQNWRQHGAETNSVEFMDLNKPANLAYDWVVGNLYFTQSRGTLHICNLHSKRCSMLFNGRIVKCNTMAVAPTVGYMFWAVSSDETSGSGFVSGIIERAQMDGTHLKTIVSEKIHSPIGLTVDFVLEKIYWTDMKVDEISSVDFAGRGRQNILSYSLQNPAGLALFEDSLFVSNIGSDTLMRCNKFTGNSRQVLKTGGVKSNTMRVVNHVNQPLVNNTCFNTTCHYMCALSNSTGWGCICPPGQVVDPADRISCKQIEVIAANLISSTEPANGMIWLIILLLLVSITGIIALSVFLYKQGRLPSQLTVSFISHDKDAMLLLDDA